MPIKKILSVVLSLIFFTHSLSGVAAAFSTPVHIYTLQCQLFIESFYNRLAVSNHPVSYYLEGVNDSEQRYEILQTINADKVCILYEEQKYKVKNMSAGAQKNQEQSKLEAFEKQFLDLQEKTRQIEERHVRMANIGHKIEAELSEEDFKVNMVLLNQRFFAQSEIRLQLIDIQNEIENKKEQTVLLLAEEIKLYAEKTDTEKEGHLLAIRNDIVLKIQNIAQQLENNRVAAHSFLKNSIAQKYEGQLREYKKFADLDFQTTEEYKNAVKAFETALSSREKMYKKRTDSLLDVSDVPVESFMKVIEGGLGENILQAFFHKPFMNLAGELPPSVKHIGDQYIAANNNALALKKEKDQSLLAELKSIITGPDFQMYTLFHGNKAKEEAVLIAVLNGDNSLLLDFVSEFSEDIKETIETEYDEQTLRILQDKIAGESLLQELLKEIDIDPGEIETLEELLKGQIVSEEGVLLDNALLQKITDAGFDAIVAYNIAYIIQLVGGYEDYIIDYFTNIIPELRGEKSTEMKLYVENGLPLFENFTAFSSESEKNKIIFSFLSDYKRMVSVFASEEGVSYELSSFGGMFYRSKENKFVRYTEAYEKNRKKIQNQNQGFLQNILAQFIGYSLDMNGADGPLTAKQKIRLAFMSRLEIEGRSVSYDISEGSSELEKNITERDGFIYENYPQARIVLQKKDSVIENVLSYQDDKIQWKVDTAGFITFYTYTDLGQKKSEVEAIAKDIFHPESLAFTKPNNFHQKREGKDSFVITNYNQYIYNEFGLLEEKRIFSPLYSKDLQSPTKTIKYSYVVTDDGEMYGHKFSKISSQAKNKELFSMDFHYTSDDITLLYIAQKTPTTAKNYSFSVVNIEALEAQENITIHEVLQINEESSFVIDDFGNIFETQMTASGEFGVVREVAYAIPLGYAIVEACVAAVASFFVYKSVERAAPVIYQSLMSVDYSILTSPAESQCEDDKTIVSSSVAVGAEDWFSGSLWDPISEERALENLPDNVQLAWASVAALIEISTQSEYDKGTCDERTNNILYRGDTIGRWVRGIWAKAIDFDMHTATYALRPEVPLAYFSRDLNSILGRHTEDSDVSIFIGLFKTFDQANYAVTKSDISAWQVLEKRIYTICVPKALMIKNIFNERFQEYLYFGLYIPPKWIIEVVPANHRWKSM